MTPASQNLLTVFARAITNEVITGEQEHANPKTLRKYAAITAAKRTELEAHIEKLERAAAALATLVGQLQDFDIEDDDAPINGGDMVEFICNQYPTLKAALS